MGIVSLLGYLPISLSSFGGVKWGIASAGVILSSPRRPARVPVGWAILMLGSILSWFFSVDRSTSWFGLFGSRYNGIAQVLCLMSVWLIYRESRSFAKSQESWEIRLFRLGFLVNALAATVQQYNGVAVTGFQGHQVFYGQVMAMAGVYLWGRGFRLLALTGLLPVLFTDSRGAVLAVVVGLAALRYGRILVLTLCIPVLAVLLRDTGSMSLADQGRVLNWKLAAKDTSAFGTGVDTFTFKTMYDKAKGNKEWERVFYKGTTDHAHNSLAEALSSQGWFGLTCFLLFCTWVGLGVGNGVGFATLLAGAICSMVNPTPFDAKLLMVVIGASYFKDRMWVRRGINWRLPEYFIPIAATASFAFFCYTTLIERIVIADKYGMTGNSAVWAKKKIRLLPIDY